ncbi:MAG: hypothetical protein ACI9XZ_004341 [Alphaproteobacteria bacterium]|jgi:hypothetical protein
MLHIFDIEIPSWQANIRADYKHSDPVRILRVYLQNTSVEVDKLIRFSDQDEYYDLNDEVGDIEISILREYKRSPRPSIFGPDVPHPFLDTDGDHPRPLGEIYAVDGTFCLVLYVGASIFDELWSRHMFAGPMPRTLKFTVEGFADGTGDQLIWDRKNYHELPVTNLAFDMSVEVAKPAPSKW